MRIGLTVSMRNTAICSSSGISPAEFWIARGGVDVDSETVRHFRARWQYKSMIKIVLDVCLWVREVGETLQGMLGDW